MTALELAALALASYAMDLARQSKRHRVEWAKPQNAEPPGETAVEVVIVESSIDTPSETTIEPMDFLVESAGEDARYYRALDDEGREVLAVFCSDGRVRLADRENRFAGIVQSGRADLLDVANNTWSELFVRVTPGGLLQLELHGGPYDARVLTCEVLQ